MTNIDERLEKIISKHNPSKLRRFMRLAARSMNITNEGLRDHIADPKNKESISRGLAQSLLYTRGEPIKEFDGTMAGAYISTKGGIDAHHNPLTFTGINAGKGASFKGCGAGTRAKFEGEGAGSDTYFRGVDVGTSSQFIGTNAGTNAFFRGVNAGRKASFEGENAGAGAEFYGVFAGVGASFKGKNAGQEAESIGINSGSSMQFYGSCAGENSSFQGQGSGRSVQFEDPEITSEGSNIMYVDGTVDLTYHK